MSEEIQYQLELLQITRQNLLRLIDELSLKQMNEIPDNYSNNIAWNASHILITQQLLCYKLSGLETNITDELIERYRKGTIAKDDMDENQLLYLKEMLKSSPEKLKSDYERGIFKDFTEYPTSYNATLRSIEDAISFNNMHEALHLGYIMALRKNL